jgi:murein DD-endopeptidase MepM/ murein hydrolase activator NlpD
MDDPSPPIAADADTTSGDLGRSCSRPLLIRLVTWSMTGVWRSCVDWRTRRPILTRITAHLSILLLALVAVAFGSVGFPALQTAMGGSLSADVALSSAPAARIAALATPTTAPAPGGGFQAASTDTVVRLPLPHTAMPDRVRTSVMTYTVRQDDTIFGIAFEFGLSPETIVWSNQEVLWDAPWLIQPGLELYIIPTDGILHTVRAQETVAGIAISYGVEPVAIYNEFNQLQEGVPLREGQLLVVAGARGEEVDWQPPPTYASAGSAGASYGICGGVGVTGPGANGWFVLPTGSTRVSGWYFHDPRNPTHIGLDYGCRLGDPIYAADNGVVTIAGWNGGYGILVELNHGNGFVTRYAHLSQLLVGCGTPVYQGQVVGYCGSTGYSTGAHLHYEVRFQGVPQNPQAY